MARYRERKDKEGRLFIPNDIILLPPAKSRHKLHPHTVIKWKVQFLYLCITFSNSELLALGWYDKANDYRPGERSGDMVFDPQISTG